MLVFFSLLSSFMAHCLWPSPDVRIRKIQTELVPIMTVIAKSSNPFASQELLDPWIARILPASLQTLRALLLLSPEGKILVRRSWSTQDLDVSVPDAFLSGKEVRRAQSDGNLWVQQVILAPPGTDVTQRVGTLYLLFDPTPWNQQRQRLECFFTAVWVIVYLAGLWAVDCYFNRRQQQNILSTLRLPKTGSDQFTINGLPQSEATSAALAVLPVNPDISQGLQAVPLHRLQEQNLALEKACQVAQHQLVEQQELLTQISHELRNPLNSLLGFASHLVQVSQVPQHVEMLEIIERSGKMLLMLTQGLLDTSQLSSVKLRLYPQPFLVRKAFEEIISLLAPKAHEKGLHITLQLPQKIPNQMHGDVVRIQQILTNLLHNAIKFTAQGDVLCRVLLPDRAEAPDRLRWVQIEVQDTGKGVVPPIKKSTIGQFSQDALPRASTIPGSGLGLSICEKLVSEMSGEMGVDNAEGGGAIFWFSIPLASLGPDLAPPVLLGDLAGKVLLFLDVHSPTFEALSRLLSHEPVTVARTTEQKLEDFLSLHSVDYILWFMDPTAKLSSVLLKKKLRLLQVRWPNIHWILGLPIGTKAYSIENLQCLKVYGYLYFPCSFDKLCEVLLNQSRLQSMIQAEPPNRRSNLEASHLRLPALPLLPLRPKRSDRFTEPAVMSRLIMVVDDHPGNLKLMKFFLGELGYPCLACDGGQVAIKRAQERIPSLIFMDIQMPGVDGVEAMRRLKSIKATANIPIVALTAEDSEKEIQWLNQRGFDQILHKPISLSAVQCCLTQFICRSSSLRSPPDMPAPTKNQGVRFFDRCKAMRNLASNFGLLNQFLEGFLKEEAALVLQIHGLTADPNLSALENLRRSLHQFSATCTYCALLPLKRQVRALQRALERPRGSLDQINWEHFLQLLKETKLQVTAALAQAPIEEAAGFPSKERS